MFKGICLHCNQPFEALSPAKKFCKPSHRVAYCIKSKRVVGRNGSSVLFSYQDPESIQGEVGANEALYEKNSNMEGFEKVDLTQAPILIDAQMHPIKIRVLPPCTPEPQQIPYVNSTPGWTGAVTSSPIIIRDFNEELEEMNQKGRKIIGRDDDGLPIFEE